MGDFLDARSEQGSGNWRAGGGRREAAFVLEQPLLARQAAGIAGEPAVRADDAMTRHDDADGIRPIGRSDGTAGPGGAEVCGELLARGHGRSGDPQVMAGYIGSGTGFAEAIAEFGVAYADQTVKGA